MEKLNDKFIKRVSDARKKNDSDADRLIGKPVVWNVGRYAGRNATITHVCDNIMFDGSVAVRVKTSRADSNGVMKTDSPFHKMYYSLSLFNKIKMEK